MYILYTCISQQVYAIGQQRDSLSQWHVDVTKKNRDRLY